MVITHFQNGRESRIFVHNLKDVKTTTCTPLKCPIMPEFSLSRHEVRKVLKQAHSGDISAISNLKHLNPDFHWSALKYEDTGDTVLHCAARLGHLETIKYLLTFDPPSVDCKNNDDKTALHEAAQFGQPDVVKLLLSYGAKVNALKRADWTPLMLACTKRCLETVEILVENGGLVNYKNKDGWTCVHLAAREGCADIFKFLVERGGDCGIRTKNGRSVLHIAALHGHVEILKVLLTMGLDLNVRDNCGNTPLHEAILGRNIEVCRTLIDNLADMYLKNNVDFDVLFLASSAGYNDMIDFIINVLGFDVNTTNSSGFTALHCAARKGHKDTCNFLIGLGCKEELRDKFGRVAFDYLRQ